MDLLPNTSISVSYSKNSIGLVEVELENEYSNRQIMFISYSKRHDSYNGAEKFWGFRAMRLPLQH